MYSFKSSKRKSFRLTFWPTFDIFQRYLMFRENFPKYNWPQSNWHQTVGFCSVMMSVIFVFNILWNICEFRTKSGIFFGYLLFVAMRTLGGVFPSTTTDLFSDRPTLKKSEMLSNWPKWLIVTQSVLFGNEDLEIHSLYSSFSVCTWFQIYIF